MEAYCEHNLAKEMSAKKKPLHTLEGCLTSRNKEVLKEIGQYYGVKQLYKMNKQEMIEHIRIAIIDGLLNSISSLTQEEHNLYDTLVQNKQPLDAYSVKADAYKTLIQAGLVYSFCFKSKGEEYLQFVMPEEIKGLKADLEEGIAGTILQESERLYIYLQGFMSLYGAFQIDFLLETYNEHYSKDLTGEELVHYLLAEKEVSGDFDILEDYVVHESLYHYGTEEFYELLEKTKDMPYYKPTQEEILCYSDDNYYEETLELNHLDAYLRSHFKVADEVIDELVSDIEIIAKTDITLNMQKIIYEFEEKNICFKDLNQTKEVIGLVIAAVNEVRQWGCRGYKPSELKANKIAGNLGVQVGVTPIKSAKVGRNDPCPCGSSKKYKKCCGK